MTDKDDTAEWLTNEIRHRGPVGDDTSLQELGVWGDDWHELLGAYAQRFNVDMSGYLWYFHTRDEGVGSIGGLFFPPPHRRVTQIPVTIGMLKDFARSGAWGIEYPKHRIPTKRYDVLVNRFLAAIGLLGAAAVLLWKCAG